MTLLHDPIPYDRVAELIAEVEPSQQSATLHDAWRDYAAQKAIIGLLSHSTDPCQFYFN